VVVAEVAVVDVVVVVVVVSAVVVVAVVVATAATSGARALDEATSAIPAATIPTPTNNIMLSRSSTCAIFTPAGLPAGRGETEAANAVDIRRFPARATATKDRIKILLQDIS
jgi:hypothetical protein